MGELQEVLDVGLLEEFGDVSSEIKTQNPQQMISLLTVSMLECRCGGLKDRTFRVG